MVEPSHEGNGAMSGGGDDQTSSGSWQPDPTGRHRLRWRNEAGDWTDHVANDDGTLGNDPYESPTAPPPGQHPPEGSSDPRDPPVVEGSEQFHGRHRPADAGLRQVRPQDFVVKRDRVLWHVCFWLGPFTLLLLWLALPFLRKRPYCGLGRTRALRALLQAEQEHGPDFLRLANALSALYPRSSDEKRLLDAMLLAAR